MKSDPKSDPVLDMVRVLPWHEDPVPSRTTSLVDTGIPSVSVSFTPLSKDPKLREQSLKDLQQVLSIETVEELTQYEDKVFALLAQDPSNVIHLLTDPVSTLQEIGVKLTPWALSELKNVRQKILTPQALQALAAIKKLSIKIEPDVGGK